MLRRTEKRVWVVKKTHCSNFKGKITIFLEREPANRKLALPHGAAVNQKWSGIRIPIAVFHCHVPLPPDWPGAEKPRYSKNGEESVSDTDTRPIRPDTYRGSIEQLILFFLEKID